MTKIIHRLPESPRLPSSPYAPSGTSDDPVRLAGVTVRAVDRIGDVAAKEIEDVAAAFEAEAKVIGDKLRVLAEAVREHTGVASAHVSEFCAKATSVVDVIRDLEAKLNGGAEPASALAVGDDGVAIPKFLLQPNGGDTGIPL